MCPFSLEQPSAICPFSHLGCHLQKTSQDIPFRLGLSPVDTGVPNGLLMLRNSLKDFAFEHRSGCCATDPGYAGNIGAIEVWLIDWLIIGNERQRSKYLSMFPIELLCVKTNPANSARNLGVIFDNNFTFRSHISAVCSSCFTTCGICGVFSITLIWIVQNYLQLLSCPVVSIIAIRFRMVLLTLTSQGFTMYRINWPTW